MSTSKLYQYNEGFGRMGDLDSVFIATDEEMKSIKNKNLYFGEVLGKHSEIIGTVDDNTIKLLSDNGTVVSVLLDVFPEGHISGICLFDYEVEEEDEDEDEDESEESDD